MELGRRSSIPGFLALHCEAIFDTHQAGLSHRCRGISFVLLHLGALGGYR